MLSRAKKTLISVLVLCIAALSGGARAEGPGADEMLQPLGLNHAGVFALRQADPNLTGFAVKLAVLCRSMTYLDDEPQNDYRPNIAHRSFDCAQMTFHDEGKLAPGISPHATAVCSILFGEDPQAFNPQLGPFQYQGLVPDAEADIYELCHFVINNVFPQSPPDADIVTASFGNEFEEWWTRGIEALAQHHGLIAVAGIGNGTNAYDPPLYPAAAANVIGVGVVDSVNAEDLATQLANFSLANPEHSTYGPTSTGRCKPDIVAPGNCLAADSNDPNRYGPTGNWSSFATPVVAGTVGLLVQKAKEDPTLAGAVSAQGGNCVIKAVLLNSATKLPYWHKGRLTTEDDNRVPLDYIQGAGMVNGLAAYEQLISGQAQPGYVPVTGWDNNSLHASTNPVNVYRITLAQPGGKVITATAVWNMHYSTAYPFESLGEKDSNLRLELWAVDPNNPDNDYLLDYSDSSVDNVEHLYSLADANYTDYEIVISMNDADEAGRSETAQQYALAWTAAEAVSDRDILWYDLNADGIVNKADLMTLVENLLSSCDLTDSYLLGDINTDGAIDMNDVKILLNQTDLRADWNAAQEDSSI